MFIIWGKIRTLIAFLYFITNLFTWIACCCNGAFIYCQSLKRKNQHLPNFLVDPYNNFDSGIWHRVSMTALILSINIWSKKLIYCTSIGWIVIKINLHWPEMSCQCIIFLYGRKTYILFYWWRFLVKNGEEVIWKFSLKVFANSKYAISRSSVNFFNDLSKRYSSFNNLFCFV